MPAPALPVSQVPAHFSLCLDGKHDGFYREKSKCWTIYDVHSSDKVCNHPYCFALRTRARVQLTRFRASSSVCAMSSSVTDLVLSCSSRHSPHSPSRKACASTTLCSASSAPTSCARWACPGEDEGTPGLTRARAGKPQGQQHRVPPPCHGVLFRSLGSPSTILSSRSGEGRWSCRCWNRFQQLGPVYAIVMACYLTRDTADTHNLPSKNFFWSPGQVDVASSTT